MVKDPPVLSSVLKKEVSLKSKKPKPVSIAAYVGVGPKQKPAAAPDPADPAAAPLFAYVPADHIAAGSGSEDEEPMPIELEDIGDLEAAPGPAPVPPATAALPPEAPSWRWCS